MPLGRQRKALLDAETVLLVDDCEREVAKSDIGLHQRMGADDNRGQAGGEARQHRGAGSPLFTPGQKADLDAGRRGVALQCRMVLACEDLGWRHQCCLTTALDRGQHCDQRHDRLAAADIALEQPHHVARPRHFRRDLGQGEALRAGQRKAERCFDRAR